MVYPYEVNHNGIHYAPGEDVPTEEQAKLNLEVEETKQIEVENPIAKEEPIVVKKKSGRKAK